MENQEKQFSKTSSEKALFPEPKYAVNGFEGFAEFTQISLEGKFIK